MIDLIKLIMVKPLQAVLATLCAVTISLYLGLSELQVAMAVVHEKQKVSETVNERVLELSDIVIRIDENLKFVKQNQIILLENLSKDNEK